MENDIKYRLANEKPHALLSSQAITRIQELENELHTLRVYHHFGNCDKCEPKFCCSGSAQMECGCMGMPVDFESTDECPEHCQLRQIKEANQVREDAKEVISTTWRALNALPVYKEWPLAGFIKSAKYHLKKADYLFNDGNATQCPLFPSKLDEAEKDLELAIRVGLTVLNEELEYYEEDESRDILETMKKKYFKE